jgi:hypothetical protein
VLASLAGVGARVYGESVGDSGEHRNFFVFCIFWEGVVYRRRNLFSLSCWRRRPRVGEGTMDLEMGRAGHVMGFRFCTARFEFEGLLHYNPLANPI